MTKEEAKRRMEICRNFLANNYSDMGEPNFTAFEMAIQALSQEPTDAISDRLLDLANAIESDDSGYWTNKRISSALRNISSVMQKSSEHMPCITPEEMQKCKDIVKKYTPKQQPCDDVVSRDWLKTAIHNFYYGLKHTPTEEDIQAYIDVAPSVTQKSESVTEFADRCRECGKMRKGHWITDDAWSDIAYNTEFLEFLYNHINPNDMEHYRQMFEMKDAVAVNGADKESSDERDSD